MSTIFKFTYNLSIGDIADPLKDAVGIINDELYLYIYEYILYFLATLVILTIMMNLLISIISNTFERVNSIK